MLLDEAWRTLGMAPTKDRREVRAAFVSAVRLTHPDRNPHPDAHERTAALITAYHVAEQALRKDESTAARLRRQAQRAATTGGTGARGTNGSNGTARQTNGGRARASAPRGAGPRGAPSRGRSAATATATATTTASGAAAADVHAASDSPTATRSVPTRPRVSRLADDTISIAAPSDEVFGFLRQHLHDLGDVTLADSGAGLIQVVVQFIESPVCYLTFDLQGRAATGSTEVFLTIESIEARPAPDLGAVTQLVVELLS